MTIVEAFNSYFNSINHCYSKWLCTPKYPITTNTYNIVNNSPKSRSTHLRGLPNFSLSKPYEDTRCRQHQLQAQVLKACADILAVPLTGIFNQASSKKLFLATVKTPQNCPYTQERRHKLIVTNCRPISLLPILSKVLETLVYNKGRVYYLYSSEYKQATIWFSEVDLQIQFIPNALLPLGRSQ